MNIVQTYSILKTFNIFNRSDRNNIFYFSFMFRWSIVINVFLMSNKWRYSSTTCTCNFEISLFWWERELRRKQVPNDSKMRPNIYLIKHTPPIMSKTKFIKKKKKHSCTFFFFSFVCVWFGTIILCRKMKWKEYNFQSSMPP